MSIEYVAKSVSCSVGKLRQALTVPIRRLEEHEHAEVLAVTARAFWDDPLFDFFSRDLLHEYRLLPAFDPYLLGWKDRSFAVPAEHARRVHPGGGVLRAVATIDGLVVGTWRARRRVELEPFGPIEETAFRAEIEDVARFSGG